MRDHKVEQELDERGYEWEYVEELSFDKVTLDLNPARWKVKIDDDRVYKIGLSVERGRKMPAIVVAITATDKFALISGRNRIEGSELVGVYKIAAYVITTVLDNFELDELPHILNVIEGKSPDHDSKLQQAAHFVKTHPERSKASIAFDFGVKQAEIDRHIAMEDAQDRADRLHVLTDFKKLDDDIRIYVCDKLKLDAVFVGAVCCLAYIGTKGNGAKRFIKELSLASSELIALEAIQEASAGHEALMRRLKRSGRRKVQTPDQIWFYAAKAAMRKWPEHPDPKTFEPEVLAGAVETIKDLRGQCNEWIEKAMEAIATWERKQAAQSKRDTAQDGAPTFDPGC